MRINYSVGDKILWKENTVHQNKTGTITKFEFNGQEYARVRGSDNLMYDVYIPSSKKTA